MPEHVQSSSPRAKPVRRAHTPLVLQMEAVECGAACLGAILEYHGRYVPLAELRAACGVSRDGSKASNMLRAARRYGLKAKGYKKELEQALALPTPYIAFWNFNHFVTVEGHTGDKVYLNDPAAGHRTVTMDEFDESFTGVVLLFEPGEDFERGGRRPSPLPALRARLRGSIDSVAFALLCGFLLVLPGLAMPALTQVFLDAVIGQAHLEWLRPIIALIVLTTVVLGLLQFMQLRVLRRLLVKLSIKMSSQFFWHLMRLPISFYSQRYAGEVASRSALNDKLASLLSGQLAGLLIELVMMVFYALLMFWYDRVLTCIGIAFAVLNFLALRWLGRYRVEGNMRLQMDGGKVQGEAIAALQSMETIKAGGLEEPFFARWAGFYARFAGSRQELELPSQVLGQLPTFLASVSTLLVLVVGGFRVLDGHLSIGMLIAFQALMASFLSPVGTLVGLGATIQELKGDMERVDDVLAHPVELESLEVRPEGEDDALHPTLEGYVDLQGITFGYSALDPPLVVDLHLEIKPGQRVALVGGSGSGKTTVANLVCGLYRPWEGRILFDGVPRDQVARAKLLNSFSSVSQEVFLFEGTVRENLTLWDETIPDRHLLRALEDAAILPEVLALPGGLDAELLEGGANLSGGQRQRLEIARALVNNPSILVLDEATSALDAETEVQIDQRLRLRGCTCLIVAHRLSTIRDCDEIIVLQRGEVVERGTHEDLWAGEGPYCRLLASSGTAVAGGA